MEKKRDCLKASEGILSDWIHHALGIVPTQGNFIVTLNNSPILLSTKSFVLIGDTIHITIKYIILTDIKKQHFMFF